MSFDVHVILILLKHGTQLDVIIVLRRPFYFRLNYLIVGAHVQ